MAKEKKAAPPAKKKLVIRGAKVKDLKVADGKVRGGVKQPTKA